MKMGAVTTKIGMGCQNGLISDGPEKRERWK